MAADPWAGFEVVEDKRQRGLLQPGNIDLKNRPRVKNADGSISTVRSMGVNIDGRELLIPTVSDDGRIMNDDEAIEAYRKTGRHLGIFDSPESSTAYAERLHDDQAAMLDDWSGFEEVAPARNRTQAPDTPSMRAAADPAAAQQRMAGESDGSAVGRAVSSLWESVNPMPLLKLGWEFSHPDIGRRIEAGRQVADSLGAAHREQFDRMYESWMEQWNKDKEESLKTGKPVPLSATIRQIANPEPIGHFVAGITPVIGPAAARAGEKIGAGDIAGGLGAAAGVLIPSASGKLTKVAGAGVLKVANAAGDASEALVRAAIKPTATAMKRVSGASASGIEAQAEKLVRFIIDNRIATAEQATNIIQKSEAELSHLLKQKNAPTDAATRAQRYLSILEKNAGKQGLPASDVATLKQAMQELAEGPMGQDAFKMVTKPDGKVDLVPTRELRPAIPAEEALESARASAKWQTRKTWGEQKGANTEAAKAVERAQRDAVKAAVPEAAPILRRQGQAIQAKEVLDRAEFRSANRDVASLPAHVMAAGEIAAGRPPVLAMAANFLRNNQLKIGFAADKLKTLLESAILKNDAPQAAFILHRLGVAVRPQDVKPIPLPRAAEEDKSKPNRVATR